MKYISTEGAHGTSCCILADWIRQGLRHVFAVSRKYLSSQASTNFFLTLTLPNNTARTFGQTSSSCFVQTFRSTTEFCVLTTLLIVPIEFLIPQSASSTAFLGLSVQHPKGRGSIIRCVQSICILQKREGVGAKKILQENKFSRDAKGHNGTSGGELT
ncbi:uncharacterized protein BCR38DRAFT_206066 [Pseudomassariella vexata]|uniref:Uncharacterized protein n=1 Tax=Pseudomassariella vexata TaxID=1141098 RepID=A0A1Y2DXY4_9PEZI|nr:uncharacterized protein BCR38DRAFT_206066 [Pseudomassariella vexata]ORY64069.1 hypothetical protein BCR38DRAFT_206066 [Pseudomassariella vexata]